MNQEKIGLFIAKLRKENNMTQQDLAEKLGVSDRTVGNWENGRNLPDVSLFKPLCNIFNITVNDLISGEIVDNKNYQEKLEENIINTINYSNKKIEEKNKIIYIILILLGIFISITALTIFPSDSSWGSIYSIFGLMISLIGVGKCTSKLKIIKRVTINCSYFILYLLVLLLIDFIGVINIHQAPRFSLVKIYTDNVIYYDTIFYDVVRCNGSNNNYTFKVIKNNKYRDKDFNDYCK